MRVRLAVGDFSRMTNLSVKALRHYHDVGGVRGRARLPALAAAGPAAMANHPGIIPGWAVTVFRKCISLPVPMR
jgi:hypothetical protein